MDRRGRIRDAVIEQLNADSGINALNLSKIDRFRSVNSYRNLKNGIILVEVGFPQPEQCLSGPLFSADVAIHGLLYAGDDAIYDIENLKDQLSEAIEEFVFKLIKNPGLLSSSGLNIQTVAINNINEVEYEEYGYIQGIIYKFSVYWAEQ